MVPGPVSHDVRDRAIQQFVRGEYDWRGLEHVGITIALRGDGVVVMDSTQSPVAVSARDVAAGWMHHAGDLPSLREWAQIVMGGIGLIALEFGETRDDEALRDALWTVSFGGQPTPSMENLARRILLRSADSAEPQP